MLWSDRRSANGLNHYALQGSWPCWSKVAGPKQPALERRGLTPSPCVR
jgi:hypothetical protein